ncbi:hypothetical protein BH11VER1_BH11VER1_42240 [soil metagenome]
MLLTETLTSHQRLHPVSRSGALAAFIKNNFTVKLSTDYLDASLSKIDPLPGSLGLNR